MRRYPRRFPDPWLRSASEAPHNRNERQRVTLLEIVIIVMVAAAIVAMAVWFVFFSHGGIGPGTV